VTGAGVEEIVVVGPVPPLKGGVAQHTDHLARALLEGGLDVNVETWANQYPTFLYPGQQYVPDRDSVPEAPYPVRRALRWFDPLGWVRSGWRARRRSMVVFALVVPVQVVPFLVIRWCAGIGRSRPRFVLIAHNVLPHEPRLGDRWLVMLLARSVDRMVVHSESEAALARNLTSTSVGAVPLPAHPPTSVSVDRRGEPATRRILFFGLVRPYKGVEDLLDALVQVPQVELLIAGEVWGGVEGLQAMIDSRQLADRVEVQAGYVADADVPAVFAACDALVLPYREGTGSQNVLLGHQLGLPVIATDVAGFATQIKEGRDGFVCHPHDPDGLAQAIRMLYESGVLDHLRDGIAAAAGPSVSWTEYLTTLLSPSCEDRADRLGR
jgi:glycosyltransferase involved in cell wall biosynthesis